MCSDSSEPRGGPIMDMNILSRQWNVGADLSRPPPIYRPVMPDDAHGRIAYAPSSIAPTSVLEILEFGVCPYAACHRYQ